MTKKELYNKIENEGGVYELAASYGLNPDVIEDGETKVFYGKCYTLAQALKVTEEDLMDHLEEVDI